MPYIGRDLSQGNYLKLDNIESQFNGSKVSFDLTAGGTAFFPGSSMALLVSVGGVVQEAETAYTIDQSSIEFASAPSAGDDCYIIVMGTSIGVSVPADGSVTMAKLAQSAIDRLSSVGISSGGTTIGTGVTFINFVQSGLTASVASGVATVNLGGKTNEEIQDIVGAMFSGNTETNITATYQDSDGTIDLVADLLTEEAVEDFVAGAITAGTNVSVTYDAAAGTITIASTDTNTQLTQEQVEDFVGGMLDGDETFITVAYDDTDGNIDFTVPVKDEDDMASDSASHLATQQSIKAYVDAQITAEDLDFQADSGGALSIDLDSETLTFTGGTGIDTSGSGSHSHSISGTTDARGGGQPVDVRPPYYALCYIMKT